MCRKEIITQYLLDAAQNSELAARHGAIVTKGSHKPIYSGFNKSRTKVSDYLMSSTHAEIDVAKRVYNYYKKRTNNHRELNRTMSKFTIWVGRILRNDTISNSEPCSDCCKKLKEMGFTKIGYTSRDGNIVIQKLSEYSNNHMSQAQITMMELI
jgi:tRNA(Arg) A34 adenosine deaminase TadA